MDPKGSRSLGAHSEPHFLQELASSSVRGGLLGENSWEQLGGCRTGICCTREILGAKAAVLAQGVEHRVALRTAREATNPAGSELRNRRWGDHSSAPNPQMSLSF